MNDDLHNLGIHFVTPHGASLSEGDVGHLAGWQPIWCPVHDCVSNAGSSLSAGSCGCSTTESSNQSQESHK